MASPPNRSGDPAGLPVMTLPAQGQEELPSLAEACQVELLTGAKPAIWRRLQDFSLPVSVEHSDHETSGRLV
jgi:hypothetical protein